MGQSKHAHRNPAEHGGEIQPCRAMCRMLWHRAASSQPTEGSFPMGLSAEPQKHRRDFCAPRLCVWSPGMRGRLPPSPLSACMQTSARVQLCSPKSPSCLHLAGAMEKPPRPSLSSSRPHGAEGMVPCEAARAQQCGCRGGNHSPPKSPDPTGGRAEHQGAPENGESTNLGRAWSSSLVPWIGFGSTVPLRASLCFGVPGMGLVLFRCHAWQQ